ncbi:hypothetical protein Lesp02_30150 [Lentzea sp. NBRC 105346]|uniref:deazapurine DNA modification protein DpdA family protein n=1 Tax=Lentzea sp. NBRC 105346 TaxID=3032205 RepID=UPI0024A1C029|nr:hypothetical protein [Lentzea sp. NBRC 105346]GLZ30826.1 hypothetical protein Lesp02_30150 [Lentzea sp. NBRC 105346]
MKFFLGIHQPIWLTRVRDIPLLVSHRRLGHRRTLPRSVTEWALDSGGFTELQLHGHWQTNEKDYVQAVRRYADEIGNLAWAAPQDWMCEQSILKRTGLTVREHQRRTVRNLVRLRELAPEVPWVPTLQGWKLSDYERCADLYHRAGIDLAAEPLVGIGTVCRRQSSADVELIMRTFATRNLNLHGFGIKITGLNRYAETLSSSDSMSWSRRGRYIPGCGPSHRTESNCLRFALSWYRRIQTTLGSTGLPADDPSPEPLARVA